MIELAKGQVWRSPCGCVFAVLKPKKGLFLYLYACPTAIRGHRHLGDKIPLPYFRQAGYEFVDIGLLTSEIS